MKVIKKKIISNNIIEKVLPENCIILGIDQSLNGSAFVKMKNFEVLDFWFFTNVIKHSIDSHAILNRETDTKRLNIIYEETSKLISKNAFNYAAIENYAFGAKGNSTFQIGGVGEMLRLQVYRSGIPFREYEPSKVKKFATNNGSAEKSEMVLAAYKAGFDVGKYGKNGEDLADAFWIATMLNNELFIHKNKDYINQLQKNKRDVFTEVTKSYPIPLLNRQFYI